MMFESFYGDYCDCCPHAENNTLHSSTEVVLHRICTVILDDVARTLMERQMMLFHHYFGLSKGELISDVQFLPLILEYLCENIKDNLEYTKPLLGFLHVCRDCPVLTKPSEQLIDHKENLANYLNSLGHCLILLDTLNDIQLIVLDIIDNLCSTECAQSVRTISFEVRKESLEESEIAALLIKFLLLSDIKLHSKILMIIHRITVYSLKCSKQLLKDGYFEQLVLFTQRIKSYRLLDIDQKQTVLNILWHLLESTENGVVNPEPLPTLVLSILDRWFRCEVVYGSASQRNDVLALICKVIYCYDNLDLAKSQILEDIFLVCALTELNIEDTWASNVKFGGTNENLQFKKILLSICAYSMKFSIARLMASTYFFIQTLALHLNPLYTCPKTKWSNPQKWELLMYSLYCLPFFAPHFPAEYANQGITGKILLLIEYFSTKVERIELVCNCIKTLNLLLLKRFIPVDHFKELRTFEIVFNLAKSIFNKPMSTLRQLILSYSFCIVSELCANSRIDPGYYCDIVTMMINMMGRFIKPLKADFKIDESLIINSGSFVWMCIRNSDRIRHMYIQRGLIYLILDIIESLNFPIQFHYTGLLAEFAEDIYSVVPMVTWRGQHENMTVLPLLLKLWRTQEKIKGVKRGDNWCALDSEKILIGKVQKKLKAEIENCAPLIDTIACMRPKIFAIITLLLRKHYDALEKAVNTYGIQQLNLSIEDEVTLKIIQYYEHLKNGEIWENILDYIKENSPFILPKFIHYLEMLVSRSGCWGVDIINDQRLLIRIYSRKVINEEEALYEKLAKCQIERELNAVYDIFREMYTTNLSFLNNAKLAYLHLLKDQRKSRNFPTEGPNVHNTHNLMTYVRLEKTARNAHITSTSVHQKVLVLKTPKDISVE